MSLYLYNLNRIKDICSTNWLTTNEERAYKQIKNWLLRPGLTFIYLYGYHGTGKTFLGWLLLKEKIAQYFANPKSCLQNAPIYNPVFVDNLGIEKSNFREIMRSLEIAGIKKAVIVGIYPIQEDIPKVNLALDVNDLKQAREKLLSNGFNVNTDIEIDTVRNFWDLFAL